MFQVLPRYPVPLAVMPFSSAAMMCPPVDPAGSIRPLRRDVYPINVSADVGGAAAARERSAAQAAGRPCQTALARNCCKLKQFAEAMGRDRSEGRSRPDFSDTVR